MEHEVNVGDATVPAINLPSEILDLIFSHLDCKTFYSARSVSRWWYASSSTTFALRRQLGKLPFRPGSDFRNVPAADLLPLLTRAAGVLMFGLRVDSLNTHDRSLSLGIASDNARALSNCTGDRTVAVKGRLATLWDTSDLQARILVERVLNEPEETLEHKLGLDITPTSPHELALSSNCRMLAVGWKQDVRIYDLFDESNEAIVGRRIPAEGGSSIVGLSFEQDDHVLKIALGSKASVLYLGSPSGHGEKHTNGTLCHWRSASGLSHNLLGSSNLRCKSSTSPLHLLVRYSAVQILRYLDDGLLLAAQRHGAGESSHFVLAHVRCSSADVHNGRPPLTVDSNSLMELVRLETYLSSRDCIVNGCGIGSWTDMPSAHPYFHSRFCLSRDGMYLILAERDKHRIWPKVESRIYVYRLPSQLKNHEVKRAHPERLSVDASAVSTSELSVARIPVCIGSVDGEVKKLTCRTITDEKSRAFTISATTADSTYAFNISGIVIGTE